MERTSGRYSMKAGMIPGTLLHVGDEHVDPVEITIFDYTLGRADERRVARLEDGFEYLDTQSVTWINVVGVHDQEVIERLGSQLGMHPLLLEDIMHTSQRPKVEEFDHQVYIVLRMLSDGQDMDGELVIKSEQISLIVGPNYVLTFQEVAGDVFDPVRNRIREDRGRVRALGADYLAYALIDVVVDNYFAVLERLGDQIEELEAAIIGNPTAGHVEAIRRSKAALRQVRHAVWPLRDVTAILSRGDSRLFKETTVVFLRDVYDHTVRVVDIVETLREMTGTMMDFYMSNVSQRMNEVMKVLTLIATIFIPLTFIAGVYGMNFDNIPELHWEHGYWYVWGVMLATVITFAFYFRRKGWF
jgi:magnesium transporter